MRRITRRNALRWFVAVVGLSILTVVVVTWQLGSALVAPANRPVGDAPQSLPVKATMLASDSGSQIATWRVDAPDARATIILLHGIGGNRRGMLGRAEMFRDAGYSVVMIDLQANGESQGEHITLGHLERHDVRAAVEHVRTTQPAHRIGVVGQSLGGAAALLAGPLDVDAMVLESVYTTIAQAVDNRVRKRVGVLSRFASPLLLLQLQPRLGVRAADLRPIDHITTVGCPVLIASGGLDEHTTRVDTEQMLATAREPKELLIFPDAAHVDLFSHDAKMYTDEVVAFFHRHLMSAGTKSGNAEFK